MEIKAEAPRTHCSECSDLINRDDLKEVYGGLFIDTMSMMEHESESLPDVFGLAENEEASLAFGNAFGYDRSAMCLTCIQQWLTTEFMETYYRTRQSQLHSILANYCQQLTHVNAELAYIMD